MSTSVYGAADLVAPRSKAYNVRNTGIVEVSGLPDVVVVEADHTKTVVGELHAELLVPA